MKIAVQSAVIARGLYVPEAIQKLQAGAKRPVVRGSEERG
jgi:hypothetical protein